MVRHFFSSWYILGRGNDMSHAAVSYDFQSKNSTTPPSTAAHIRGCGRSLATTCFWDPNTSRQITCLRNYWRRPMGSLAQQSSLCHAAITDQYRKNQSCRSHKGSLRTVVILSDLSSVVFTSINSILLVLSQRWLVQCGSISSSAQFTVHAGIKSWLYYLEMTEMHRIELCYTLTFYFVETELCGLSRGQLPS